MNKIASVAEVTTSEGKRTFILRLDPGTHVTLSHRKTIFIDELTVDDLRRLIHACQNAAMSGPVRDAEFGNDPPHSYTTDVDPAYEAARDAHYSQTVVLPSYQKAG